MKRKLAVAMRGSSLRTRARRENAGTRSLRRRLVWAVTLFGLVGALAVPAAASADIGVEGASFVGTSEPTGSKRGESALWWNDGWWWANMWNSVARDFHIFRFDPGAQRWVDTGVKIDTRSSTSADTLWDGTHLYVASHRKSSTVTAGYPAYLYRFSYNPAADTYSLDPGFPATINNYMTENLVIEKDSTGKLWATWQQGAKIYVNRTVGGDATWGTPFELAVAGSVGTDDTSAVVAFGGNKIGIMWSNQLTASHGMYFSVHVDGQPDTSWGPRESAFVGPKTGDDHINLKSFEGRVYAATKTSMSGSSPLIKLLVRDPAGGWTNYTFGTGSNCHNRPIVVIDETARRVRMFATGPQPPTYSCDGLGAIYEKTAALDNISFAPGYGTPVIQDDSAPDSHNVAGSKHNVTSATGLVALAINKATDRYWHHWNPLAPPTPPVANFSGSPTSGSAPLSVSFTDTSTGAPTSWSWSFGDGGTSTERNPSHAYAAAGTYTVSLTASNPSGSDTETKTGYITVGVPPPAPPPNADFTGSPTSGSAPLTVSFTDTSTNAPTSWSWNFGDATTSTDRHPSHTYTLPGLYTVSLTATNASGSDTETKVAYVNVGVAPSTVTVRPEADAHVTTYSVAKNYGTIATLRVREDPASTYRSYLKFTVTGVVGIVRSAKLRLYVTDASPDGGSVYVVENGWTETGITWNNAPAIGGTPVASTGSVALSTWVEVDVTAAVSGNGTYSFALKNASTNSAIYSSREGTQPPQLVVTIAP